MKSKNTDIDINTVSDDGNYNEDFPNRSGKANSHSRVRDLCSSQKGVAGQKKKRLDGMKDSNIERYAENLRLVRLVEGGLSVNQAIKETGSDRPRRTVQDLVTRFKEAGKEGLIDGRWSAVKLKRVMTDEVCELTLALYFERPAAGFRAVAELVAESCQQRGFPIPSQSSVKKFLQNLPKAIQLARKGSRGLKEWNKQGASVVEQKKTTFSNELWQGDHTPPEIWIRQKIDGSWEPVNVYLSAFVDDYSRAIPGINVSTKYSDAWSISILSYYAFNKKNYPGWLVSGYPFAIESDCGADWIGENVQTCWKSLGINPVIDYPHYPNLKGKVERWFRVLDSNCLRKLPGHFDAIGRSEGAARKHVPNYLL